MGVGFGSFHMQKGMDRGMPLCILSERCKKIIHVLLRENDFVSTQKIAEITGVSKRSIYYDICNINEWLEERGIKELAMERGKGIRIPQIKSSYARRKIEL